MDEIKFDLQGFTLKQYCMLILRDELEYSFTKSGDKLGISRNAASNAYRRAKLKLNN
jgi:predicted DNA-binding protein (UPF0251 family)